VCDLVDLGTCSASFIGYPGVWLEQLAAAVFSLVVRCSYRGPGHHFAFGYDIYKSTCETFWIVKENQGRRMDQKQ
jgi:hypothetical protein